MGGRLNGFGLVRGRPQDPDADVLVRGAAVNWPVRRCCPRWPPPDRLPTSLGPRALLTLDADPRCAGVARCFCRTVLDGWGVAASDSDTALLVVSELVTNALQACTSAGTGRSWLHRGLVRTAEALVVTVCDPGPALPRQVACDVNAETGRGLLLVSALTRRWGTCPFPGGKAVWCELDTSGPATRTP